MEADRDANPSEFDEAYFDGERRSKQRVFDAELLGESISELPCRTPLIFGATDTVSKAMHAMQEEHRGCVLVSEDGTDQTRLIGIFTERDVLLRIIDRGRNPATLELTEVMTRDPECLPVEASIAWALNKMSVGGFRHVPVVQESGFPAFVVSVRDVVEFLVETFPQDVLNLPPEPGADRQRKREGA